jgi:uncharacterized protein (TIGR00369 family)
MTEPDEHPALPPHAAAIGITLVASGSQRCTLRVTYAEHLIGDPDTGVLHGGVITAVLDNASGMAVRMGEAGPNQNVTMATLDLRIDYMRAAEPGRDLYADAECYKTTPQVAFVRAVAYEDTPEEPVATSVATFMIGTANAPRP